MRSLPAVLLLAVAFASPFSEACDSTKELPTVDYLIRKFGYPAESHSATTSDGHVLGLFRVPRGRHDTADKGEGGKPAILLMHGLAQNAATFLLRSEESLPFLLADKGFDVWLGSARGTSASSKHLSLSEDSKQFWDFSWHENGLYDVPAMVSYIKNVTGRDQIQYVGHSMGTTMFFVMCSLRPEECARDIGSAHLLAPVTYLRHTKGAFSPVSKLVEMPMIHPVVNKLLTSSLVHGELALANSVFRQVAVPLCSSKLLWRVCLKPIEGVVGPIQEGTVSQQEVADLLCYSMDSLSSKQFLHYAQGITQDLGFRQFDLGEEENFKVYGSATPPEYPLENITVPLSLYTAARDYFVMEEDLQSALSRLQTVKRLYQVPSSTFTHVDFLFRKDVKELLYDQVVMNALRDAV